ncbi:MAG TPA: hypothetical protein VL326_07255 [Kofleriaceae bacterium]|nr:hypothetical protein [Kofleriaceae bacterium]
MKSSAALAGVALVALTIAACLVHRPSDEFTCSTDTDCKDGRTCQSNYCALPNCPADCDSCNESAKTCTMNCSTDDNCGSVRCPDGWTCTINCMGDGACDDVTCDSDSQCNITCSGTNACNDIQCHDSCKCDLTCASGACDTISCPTGMAASRCTTDGTAGSPCLSTPAGCTKC